MAEITETKFVRPDGLSLGRIALPRRFFDLRAAEGIVQSEVVIVPNRVNAEARHQIAPLGSAVAAVVTEAL